MKKNYIIPEESSVRADAADVIRTSGEPTTYQYSVNIQQVAVVKTVSGNDLFK